MNSGRNKGLIERSLSRNLKLVSMSLSAAVHLFLSLLNFAVLWDQELSVFQWNLAVHEDILFGLSELFIP